MVASKVFIARHGERIDHVDDGWRSRTDNTDDPFLTERGLAQARNLGLRLAGENISKIFVSPFYRTLQTAAAAAASIGSRMHVEPGMCEALLPEWFGGQPRVRILDAVVSEFPAVERNYTPIHHSEWPETKESCMERVRKTVRTLSQREEGAILLVGHGITCEYAARALVGVETVPYIDYCGLIECVRVEGVQSGNSLECKFEYGAIKGPDTSYISDGVR